MLLSGGAKSLFTSRPGLRRRVHKATKEKLQRKKRTKNSCIICNLYSRHVRYIQSRPGGAGAVPDLGMRLTAGGRLAFNKTKKRKRRRDLTHPRGAEPLLSLQSVITTSCGEPFLFNFVSFRLAPPSPKPVEPTNCVTSPHPREIIFWLQTKKLRGSYKYPSFISQPQTPPKPLTACYTAQHNANQKKK